jgi:hypothetical protein
VLERFGCDVDFLPAGNRKNTSNSRSFKILVTLYLMMSGNLILKGTTFTKYKQFIDNCFKILPRQALHAKTLGFVHPTTGEMMRFDTELPQDFQDCIEKWRGYSKTI